MKKQKILGMPAVYFVCVAAVLVLGIISGSFFDFEISEALANKTSIGSLFATCGSYFSYCLYPAAGMCFFLALKKKGRNFRFPAWVLLITCYFLAVYYTNSYSGSKVRELFSYVAGESSPLICVLSWSLLAVIYAWVPPVAYFLFDDSEPDRLIAAGLTVMAAGIVSDNVNLWLKQVASRPRYKYLITLDNPVSEFRNWWQWLPNLAGTNDNFKSWPSGNMTIASMMFTLPLFSGVIKKKSNVRNTVFFALSCAFVLLYGYNRIHMTNHFLTDVCFGTLITLIIHAVFDRAFTKTLKV